MRATTIKVEDPLLKKVEAILPPHKSLSAFVKETLEHEIHKRRMVESAEQYAQFLQSSSDETAWVDEWESASLDTAPSHGKKGKK